MRSLSFSMSVTVFRVLETLSLGEGVTMSDWL